MGLDVGPNSIKLFNETLDTTLTVIWNGPMGVFEFEKFAAGTDVSRSSLFPFSFSFCNFLAVQELCYFPCLSSRFFYYILK
jgi:Phosphoglycerate kinase